MKQAKWAIITSHYSGETNNVYIVSSAVGLRSRKIKPRAICRPKCLTKSNHYLPNEEELRVENTILPLYFYYRTRKISSLSRLIN